VREIKSYKGGDKMKTLTRNIVKQEDNILTKEQMDQIIPILEEIERRRKLGLEKYYTEEEVNRELEQIIEEAKKKNGLL